MQDETYWTDEQIARVRELFGDIKPLGLEIVGYAEDQSPHLPASISLFLSTSGTYLMSEEAVAAMGGDHFDPELARMLYDRMVAARDMRALMDELMQRPAYVVWKRRQDAEAMNRPAWDYGM